MYIALISAYNTYLVFMFVRKSKIYLMGRGVSSELFGLYT